MTPKERRTLMIVASVVGAVLLLLVVAALVSGSGDDTGDNDDSVVAGGSTSSSVDTTTSSTLPDLTGIAVAPSTSSTAAVGGGSGPPGPTTSTSAALPPSVGPQGAVLARPGSAATRAASTGACESMGATGWDVECGFFDAKGGRAAWLVESQTAPNGSATARRAFVLRQRGTSAVYDVELEALDQEGTRFAEIAVAVADVSGDGAAEVAFGFRRASSSNALGVDLVEGPGRVVVHRELNRGAARVSRGQLDTWSADPSSSNTYVHEVIRFTAGSWRIVATAREPGPPPPSQL